MTAPGPELDEFDVANCRVCLDIKQWQKRAARAAFGKAEGRSTGQENAGGTRRAAEPSGRPAGAASLAPLVVTTAAHETRFVDSSECPLDTEELGRATWAFLHTMAAYYPVRATTEQQGLMATFFEALGQFYPCRHCAMYLRSELAVLPPQTGGRAEFSLWMCRLHNLVNSRLGKSQFDCARVLERWREGREEC